MTTTDQPPVPAELSSPQAAQARIADLEDQLAKAQAQLAARSAPPPGEATPGTVRLKVEEPHAEMHYGGITVGADWTEVPAAQAAALHQAAADAGVTLTEEG